MFALLFAVTVAQQAHAELPPFVSDRFDLYQLGSYQNPITYVYAGTLDTGYRTETFQALGTVYQLPFHFDPADGSWQSAIGFDAPWFDEEGRQTLISGATWTSGGMINHPWDNPIGITAYDDAVSDNRHWQVEWIEPSGEWTFQHFMWGLYYGIFFDNILCLLAGGIRIFTVGFPNLI